MSNEKSASILHYALLWLIENYGQFLRENKLDDKGPFSHRIAYDHLLFLVCHQVSLETGGAILAAHTRFFPAGHGGDAADFVDIKETLAQCSNQGWLDLPSMSSATFGYHLTAAGERYLAENRPRMQKITTANNERYDLHDSLAGAFKRFAGESIRRLKSRVHIIGKFSQADSFLLG